MGFNLGYLLLTVQGALLDSVVPSLRAVTVDFDEEILSLRFFFDEEINDQLFDLASCASIEVNPYNDHAFIGPYNEDLVIYLPYPKKIPIQGRLVYLRKEPMFPEYRQPRASQLWPDSLPLVNLRLDMMEVLLGKITPPLRCVLVGLDKKKKLFRLFFYYDGEISHEDRELALAACRDVGVFFPEYSFDKQIFRVDWPERIPDEGEEWWAVYWRKEEYPEFPKPILTRRETIVLKAKSLRSFLRRKWYNFWLKKCG